MTNKNPEPDNSQSAKDELTPIVAGSRGLELSSIDNVHRFAQWVLDSGLAPRGIDTVSKIIVSIETGRNLGLQPMQALNALAIVNGSPSLKVEVALALVRASGKIHEWHQRRYTGKEMTDEWACIISSERNDMAGLRDSTFSLKEAKDAHLFPGKGRDGKVIPKMPWNAHPKWMLYCRALGRHMKEFYSDVTWGLALEPEVRDYSPEALEGARRIEGPPPKDNFLAKLEDEAIVEAKILRSTDDPEVAD